MDILNEFLVESRQKAVQDYNHFKSLVTWLEEDGCCGQQLIYKQVMKQRYFKNPREIMIPYKRLGFNVVSYQHAPEDTQHIIEFECGRVAEIFESLGLVVEVEPREHKIYFRFKGVAPKMASILIGKELVETD